MLHPIRPYHRLVKDALAARVASPESTLRRVPTSMLVIAAVAALLAVAWHIWVIPIDSPGYGLFNMGIDTRVYRGAGGAFLHGEPVYDLPVYRAWRFTYPPFAALLMTPLGVITTHHALILWNAANVISLIVLIGLSLRALRFRFDARTLVLAASIVVAVTVIEPVHTTLWNGQINLVLAILVVGDLVRRSGTWQKLQGIGVGLAAGIKLTPIFFVAYLLAIQRFRAALMATATFAFTVIIGILVMGDQGRRFWTEQLSKTGRIGPLDAPANQSFNGFFARLATTGIVHLPSWLWIPVGAIVGISGLWAASAAHRAGSDLLAVSITGMTSCGVSPFAWGHHWVWVVPLLLVAFVHASDLVRRGEPTTWLWWLAPTAVIALTFSYWQEVVRVVPGRTGVYERATVFGSFRGFGRADLPDWQVPFHLIGSGAYLLVLIGTIVVTLWWTRRSEPIPSGAKVSLIRGDNS